MKFHSTEELIEDIRLGKMVILVDDEDRENEGDIVMAADHVSPETINFMAAKARGLICLSLSNEQVERLRLPLMVRDDLNFSPNRTAFTVSIEAATGVTTGISAADRAHTIRVASSPAAKPLDVHMPGHIFPIRAQTGGVLKRAGHTEGSIDLVRLAGLNPAAVICEVMNEDGSMARSGDLMNFAEKHQLKIGTIVDLIEHRLRTEMFVEEIQDTSFLPLEFPNGYRIRIFKNKLDGVEHFVLQRGEISKDQPVMVRMHVDHYIRETFSMLKFGRSSLSQALARIDERGAGLFILLRGQNQAQIAGEIKSWVTPSEKLQPPGMDERDYGVGAQILRALGVHKIDLITSRPERRVGLKAFGLEIVNTVKLDVPLDQQESH